MLFLKNFNYLLIILNFLCFVYYFLINIKLIILNFVMKFCLYILTPYNEYKRVDIFTKLNKKYI